MSESGVVRQPEPAGQSQAEERLSLDRSLASGIAWTGGIKWASQIVSWAGTLVVARLLVPEDFGIIGIANLVLGFISLVNEFGIGAAIVQRKEISPTLVSQLGGFSVALGAVLFALGLGLSPLVARFFVEPRVQLVMMALALNFAVDSFKVIPRSLLTRDMAFRTLAWVDGLRMLGITVLTVVLAWVGFAYWSLVIGSIASSLWTAIVLFRYRPFRPSWPKRLADISRELRFGWHVVASRIAWYTYSNADFAVVGRALGTAPLGAYNIGWSLASMPVEKISTMIMQVTPPVFAKVQDRPIELRRYLRVLTEAVSVVTFPVGIGLALVAPEFVRVLLGERWLPAVVPLQILAVYGGFRSVTPFFAQILVATDHARLSMYFSFLAAVMLIPSFVVGAHWGPAGVAMAWVVVYPVVVVAFHLPTTFRIISLSPGSYLASLWPALSGCALMAAAVLGVRVELPAGTPPWLSLALEVSVGALVYCAVLLLLHRGRVRTAMDFVRRARSRS